MMTEAASRLCSACGLCCNGVLFHTVRILPEDSVAELSALGLKLKRKKGERWLQQPCPAYQDCHCTIYRQRPQRCRLFECRQLQQVAAGELTEEAARETIHEAKARVEQVEKLMAQCGGTNPKRPLAKRYEKLTAEPLDPESESGPWREELDAAMRELAALLDQKFRIN